MCGIAGIVSLKGKPIRVENLKGMCDVISHRGPDDAGYFLASKDNSRCALADPEFTHISPSLSAINSEEGQHELRGRNWDVFLGHRRLAVIDLSPAAHQPMSDASGNVWLVYNGEIYNFMELRAELEGLGCQFASRSDTEVIIHAYNEWGLDCVKKFNGMFAFALWDNSKKELYLVRDRYGIKPLYYAVLDGLIVFASEIKAILQYPDYRKRLNISALNEYFTFQNLFRYETMFQDIHLLPPANIAVISFNSGFSRHSYWDYNFTDRDRSLSFEDTVQETLRLFKQAVKRQLVADVPVGCYLSGGMDSGSITAIASEYIPRLTTFTAGFELSRVTSIESSFDERKDAELMANEFRTEHYEQVINAGDLSWAMPKVIYHMEDLRVGMSYPNYYISRLASKFVKVCLSGAGGDELYGGYPWRYYRVFHSVDREDFFSNYYDFWQRLVKDEDKKSLFQEGVFREMKIDKPYDIFRRVFKFNDSLQYDTPEDHIANSLYFEIKTFLHGLLLVGDKLSMANSLEERFPFLDNDLVDFGMKIPIRHKLANIESMKLIDENEVKRNTKYYQLYDDGKNVLRQAMRSLLPDRIVKREKQGFSAPDESWYRGENFEYVRDTLLSQNTVSDKYINKDFVRKTIEEHAGGINHRLLIWSLISFEEWCRQFGM
jgi:asparagine synthase (glutamine-hydrolysing)